MLTSNWTAISLSKDSENESIDTCMYLKTYLDFLEHPIGLSI